jgi:hypothetical protein
MDRKTELAKQNYKDQKGKKGPRVCMTLGPSSFQALV